MPCQPTTCATGLVPQWSLATIYKGMADYMVIQVIVLILLLWFPQIALWLPSVAK